MQQTGQERLARAGFPRQQHGQVVVCSDCQHRRVLGQRRCHRPEAIRHLLPRRFVFGRGRDRPHQIPKLRRRRRPGHLTHRQRRQAGKRPAVGQTGGVNDDDRQRRPPQRLFADHARNGLPVARAGGEEDEQARLLPGNVLTAVGKSATTQATTRRLFRSGLNVTAEIQIGRDQGGT